MVLLLISVCFTIMASRLNLHPSVLVKSSTTPPVSQSALPFILDTLEKGLTDCNILPALQIFHSSVSCAPPGLKLAGSWIPTFHQTGSYFALNE